MSAPALVNRGEQLTLDQVKRVVLATNLVWWDHPDLDDIVQEVLIKLWQNPEMAAPVIARSTTIDYLRRHGTHTRNGVEKATENTISLDAIVRDSESVKLADTVASDDTPISEIDFDSDGGRKLLAMLSPHEHYTVLALAAGVPMNQIAIDLDVTISRVSQHAASARERWLGLKPPSRRPALRERPQERWGRGWDSPRRRRQEIRLLQGLADGVPIQKMADDMGVTRRSVQHYLAGAMRRLGASSKPQAVAEAFRRGLIK